MVESILKDLNLEYYTYDIYTNSIILKLNDKEKHQVSIADEIYSISSVLEGNNISFLIDDMAHIGLL